MNASRFKLFKLILIKYKILRAWQKQKSPVMKATWPVEKMFSFFRLTELAYARHTLRSDDWPFFPFYPSPPSRHISIKAAPFFISLRNKLSFTYWRASLMQEKSSSTFFAVVFLLRFCSIWMKNHLLVKLKHLYEIFVNKQWKISSFHEQCIRLTSKELKFMFI